MCTPKKRHSSESIKLTGTEAVPINLRTSPVRLGHRVWGEVGEGAEVVRD